MAEPQIKWAAEDVTKFVQSGGNFFTTFAISEKILNEFGVEVIEGEIDADPVASQNAHINHQHAFASFEIDLKMTNDISRVFKLRNDVKVESKYNALIQNAMSLPPGSAICTKTTCTSSSQSVSLLATMESRKGSRFMAAASLKLAAQKDLLQWVQGDKFNVKIGSLSHVMSNSGGNRGRTDLQTTIYRINDRINVRLCLADGRTEERFRPTDPSDFQFELKMMNIQLRKSFDSTLDADGCLTATNIQLPSKPAVYTLRISHNRPGWSQLAFEERILVRPFRHDEFPRFLPVAFPYYFSWIGVLIASYFILLPSFFKILGKK